MAENVCFTSHDISDELIALYIYARLGFVWVRASRDPGIASHTKPMGDSVKARLKTWPRHWPDYWVLAGGQLSNAGEGERVFY